MIAYGTQSIVLMTALAILASCGLPRSGPNKSEIFAGSVLKGGDTFIVSVNSRVTRITAVQPAVGFPASFRNAGLYGADTIAPGDMLNFNIYENVTDEPLLGGPGQRIASIQQLEVDEQGFVFVPYAGRIKASGQSPESLRKLITSKLDQQTPDPQVMVSRLAGDGSSISISGTAGVAGIHPIDRNSRTLATMLSKIGTTTPTPENTLVRVVRGKSSGKIWLNDLWADPTLDVPLRPGDQIIIEKDTRTFISMGAMGAQAVVPFSSPNMSAIEAIATVGGLQTMTADPKGVFVLRNEPAEIANAVLGRKDLIGAQRMAYVLDLTKPNALFEAREFVIRDGDMIYVTEASYVQWTKTLSVLTGATTATSGLIGSADALTGAD